MGAGRDCKWSTTRSFRVCFPVSGVCFLIAAAAFGQEPAVPTPQTPSTNSSAAAPSGDARVPLAIVPNDGRDPNSAVEIRGAVDVYSGKAVIGSSGTVTAGEHPVAITLPQRGELRLCGTSKVSLTRDASVASADHSGLMMALDHGAMEANLRTGENSDVILTPDFRILISGPGVAAVRVRLGPKGDTCVDNHGADAPYVTVSSVFEGGAYRVQSDQRVMFEHGSLREVVDNEKESCGCPAEPAKTAESNAFPVAQSEGLAPLPKAAPNTGPVGTVNAQATATLQYDGTKTDAIKAQVETAPAVAATLPPPRKPAPKRGFFQSIGHFFKKLFGG